MADPLSDVLSSVRLTGAVWFTIECGGAWAAAAPPSSAVASRIMPGVDHVLEFHAVTRGRCLGGLAGEPPEALEAGDVICFPHGDAHVLGSAAGQRPVALDPAVLDQAAGAERPLRLRFGDGASDVRVLCGFLGCDARPFNPLLATLPRLLRASDRGRPPGGWLSRFVEAAEAEALRPRPGGDGVLARLSEILFVEVVRRHLEALPDDRAGWLAGLRHPQVGRALAALHARPAEDWSLESLARQAGLSRSALAERFAALVGEPPMQYLARWRMQVAAGLLTSTHDGLAAIGVRVGYRSEAAFNRAFRKLVGMPPATWRRARRGPAAGPPVAAAAAASVVVATGAAPGP